MWEGLCDQGLESETGLDFRTLWQAQKQGHKAILAAHSQAGWATLREATAFKVLVLHIQTHHSDNRCHKNKELFLKPVQFSQMTHHGADS